MEQEKVLQNILETVEFIKDNAATKEELKSEINSLEQRMDSKATEAKDEIMTQIDKFIALHQKLDLEMSAFRSRFERLELEMQQKSFQSKNSVV
jgi:hypothetical protein